MTKHHEEHPEYGELGIFAGYGECDDPPPIVHDSTKWTGLPSGWRIGFKSKTQLPLVMVWREYYNQRGDVEFALCLWTTRALPMRIRYSIHDWIKRWLYDNSRCSICGTQPDCYPMNPFQPSFCEKHCSEHDYEYDRGMGCKCCNICGTPQPYGYHDYD